VLDRDAQAMFLDHVVGDFAAALRLLIKRARGDHSPDNRPKQFPKVTDVHSGLPAWDLFKEWQAAAKPKPSTVARWRAVFLKLKEDFGDERPIASLNFDEALGWVQRLVNDERSSATVGDVWLSAARTVCAWGKQHRKISHNPFAGLPFKIESKPRLREDAFTTAEAQIILKSASAIADTDRPFEAVKRWVPWLCAYTGARAGEITQLRGSDVFTTDSIPVIRITPEAGTQKNDQARVVPLHEHLIAQGFLEFAAAKGAGPLFYDASKAPKRVSADPTRPTRPRYVKQRERLAAWVREMGVTDPGVRPNHGWRDTFKQLGHRAGITERILDFVCGHSPVTVGRGYGVPTPEDMANELKKFPRYVV
jgi:integrase